MVDAKIGEIPRRAMRVIRVLLPLVISDQDLVRGLDILEEALAGLAG